MHLCENQDLTAFASTRRLLDAPSRRRLLDGDAGPSPLDGATAAPDTLVDSTQAFKNESFDKTPPKGGLSTQKKTVAVKIGSRTVQALPGQRMKDVVRAARAPIKFNCEDGQCGTCESKVDGRVTRVCVAKIPARGCTITRK